MRESQVSVKVCSCGKVYRLGEFIKLSSEVMDDLVKAIETGQVGIIDALCPNCEITRQNRLLSVRDK